MPTYRESHSLDAWKGPRSEIERLAELAQKLIKAALPDDPDLSVGGTVDYEDRSEDLFKMSQLAHLASSHDDGFVGVTAYIGTSVDDTISVTIRFDHVFGASVDVDGTDQVIVGGVYRQLERELDLGKRHISPPSSTPIGLFVLSLALSVGGLGLILANIDAAGLALIAIGVLVGATAAFSTYILPRLVPVLEFTSTTDPETRAERLAKRGKAFGLFLAGAFATALIYAVVDWIFS